MSIDARLLALADAARHDLSCACGGAGRTRSRAGTWIYPASLPGGGTLPVLKVALSASCDRGCAYCGLRQGGSGRKEGLAPDVLAREFMRIRQAGLVDGLFLSSAIEGSPVATMDAILATASILRRRHGFRGYMHLKVIPGAERAQVERAAALATRLSVNAEVPSGRHLAAICPQKRYEEEILSTIRLISTLVKDRRCGARSQTTQFVVGAADETDREIVERTGWFYDETSMARVYFSAFQPVASTPLESRPAAPFIREHRLYQADFLLRKYGFHASEIPFDEKGGLDARRDPKQAWADAHPETFPLEVNRAERELLLRVPGLGPRAVASILDRRARFRLHEPGDMGIATSLGRRAAPYLLFDGRKRSGDSQLSLL